MLCRENLKQKCKNYGNQYTLWWLFRVLMRQEKGWIEDFYKFVQEQNYASSASCGPLAQIILDFFDFESGKQEFFLQRRRVLQCTFETKQNFCITVLGLSVAFKLFMLMIRTAYLLTSGKCKHKVAY